MIIWGILFAVFALLEIAIPALVSVWFALGALVMVVLSLFISAPMWEVLIFAVISMGFFVGLRPYAKRFLQPKETIRKEEVEIAALVREETMNCKYEVRYKGSLWSAEGEYGYGIGEKAYIKGFSGNKIILERKGD